MTTRQQPTERVEELFRLFKRAVEEERKAQVMYQAAIALCDDRATRTALQGLYEDEVRHEREVVDRYNQLHEEFELND
jgi:rubrerythrin